MHELSITQNMLDLVLAEADRAGARRVGRVNLVVGQMTGVVADCMRFYFDLLSRETRAEGAALSFREVPTTAHCQDCRRDFAVGEFDWTCPQCHGNNIEVVAGRELMVESIEVE